MKLECLKVDITVLYVFYFLHVLHVLHVVYVLYVHNVSNVRYDLYVHNVLYVLYFLHVLHAIKLFQILLDKSGLNFRFQILAKSFFQSPENLYLSQSEGETIAVVRECKFLAATGQLYKRVCRLVGLSVGRPVRRSVCL